MVMNVRNEPRLSMSQNHATIKALVIMLIHMTHQIDSLFDEFADELILLKSIPPGIDKADYPHHFNAESDLIESLLNHDSSIISSSSKIDSLLDEFAGELILLKSIPPGTDEADCDLEEEIRLIEKLFYDNSSPRPSKEFNSKNYDVIINFFSPSPIP
nr:hypothetical protein [Tanacetum cinerariifolium]